MGRIKRIQTREDGYLSLQLQNRSDVDLYMLEQLNKQSNALACVQKRKAATTFLYDIRCRLPLQEVLSYVTFSIKEALVFLRNLFTTLFELETSFPIHVQLDYIYMDEQKQFYCVILPIHEHYNEEIHWSSFLLEILQVIRIENGEALLGYLYTLSLTEWRSCEEILQMLEKFYVHTPISYFIYYIKMRNNAAKHQKEQEERLTSCFAKVNLQQVGNECTSIPASKVHGDTVPLFEETKKHAFLKNKEGKQIMLQKENWIGRANECSLCLPEPAVSTHHACILKTKDGYIVKDLHSSNGTYVNQMPVDENGQSLQDGDCVCFAKEEWYFYEQTSPHAS